MNKQTRKIVVTGAGGTLCSEMARSLAGQGFQVVLIGRDMTKLKRQKQKLPKKVE